MTRQEEKKQLRAVMRRMESALSRPTGRKSDAAICRALLAMPEYQAAGSVFCFVGTAHDHPPHSGACPGRRKAPLRAAVHRPRANGAAADYRPVPAHPRCLRDFGAAIGKAPGTLPGRGGFRRSPLRQLQPRRPAAGTRRRIL